MKALNQFFINHGSKLIVVLLVLLYLKSCGVDREVNRLKKEVTETSTKTLDILKTLPTATDLKVEGLSAEKRMIQSTDRKMLDVQRQTEIEKEIKILGVK
jgi:hypothetical protein